MLIINDSFFDGVTVGCLQVFSHSLRQGSNSCSNQTNESDVCPFLCMGRPNHGHSCLCPDGLKVSTDSNGRVTCLCPNDEPSLDGTCPIGNTN